MKITVKQREGTGERGGKGEQIRTRYIGTAYDILIDFSDLYSSGYQKSL